jgi:two-component system CheB/CheR fusion protein
MTRKTKTRPKTQAAAADAAAATTAPPASTFPIVGIGASAGGLAAFEAFFSAMPADTESGMALVLVQHLAPDHKSILTDLIQRYTRMQVFEVEDGVRVRPNCAYIIPPNRDMAFLNGALHLLEQSAPRGQRLPIDYFFRSLAQDQRERAICIVLSGTGSDGTLGLRAIKGEGGMAMVQNPESTEYDGMPRSAIATGLVDYVLPPAEMPAQLIAYVTHAFAAHPRPHAAASSPVEDTLKQICVVLRAQTGHDFSQYKQNTLVRRIERRMALHQIERVQEYLHFLQKTPAEADALFRDLLIGVTSFFRDPEAFAALQTQVIPRLFLDKPAGSAVRIWVCGCSTGEEAYSLAILLHEYMETLRQTFKVQIFATDVDRQAIEQARLGLYPASIASDLTPERMARYFTQAADDGVCRVQKSIRDLLIFSEQDVIRDPPFSKLDFVSCRNLLIYLNSDLQRKLISLFHYALNADGVLLLGTSETVGEFGTLFSPLDRKWKIFQRREDLAAGRPTLSSLMPPRAATSQPRGLHAEDEGRLNLRTITEQALLAHYAQSGVLVNGRGEILYIYGRTGHFLEPAPGAAGINILAMAREGLRRELTLALHQAVVKRAPVHHTGLRVRTNGNFAAVNLTVLPVDVAAGAQTDMFLVILEAAPPAPAEPGARPLVQPGEARDSRIAELEQLLRAKEEYLQTTLEEMETSNEELKSTNEEMQSVNEELQSTNEELETSKEELQSVNEELATVNAELQIKVADLSRANNDMSNLLAGTGIGTFFVDLQLRVMRFTPSATQVINLIQSDIGRPVAHVVSNLVGYDRLVEDISAVLDTLIPIEMEVQTRAGAWYSMRIRPYRTLDNVIEGAVLSFVDISERRRLRELSLLAIIARDSNDAIIVQAPDGCILAWNRGAVRAYGWSEMEALRMNIAALVPDDQLAATQAYLEQVRGGQVLEPFKAQRKTKEGRILDVWMTATRLLDDAGALTGIATTERSSAGRAADKS